MNKKLRKKKLLALLMKISFDFSWDKKTGILTDIILENGKQYGVSLFDIRLSDILIKGRSLEFPKYIV